MSFYSPRTIIARAVLASLMPVALSGCGANFGSNPSSATPLKTSLGHIQGNVFGGRTPIVGAQIYVFAASTSGYGISTSGTVGTASTSLLTSGTLDTTPTDSTFGDYYVTTDTNGSFDITGNYTCTAGTQVYLYSKGGVTVVGGDDNPQVGLLALLGTCPASGTLAGTISYIYMNEVSTVAAAYAVAGFAFDPTHIGSSGTALAQIGIANAFANAANLYNLFSPPNPNIASSSGALATTPAGNGTVPQTKLNMLANILVACVNSGNTASASSDQCNQLRAYATSDGTTGTLVSSPATTGFSTNAPGDTATAILNIAHHPSNNVSNLAFLQSPSPVYSPSLSSAPSSFVVELNFTGAGLVNLSSVAIDGFGNVWTDGGAKLSSTGAPISVFSRFCGNCSLAIDQSNNVWAPPNSYSISKFSNDGAALTNASLSSNGYRPGFSAVDGNNNVWVPGNSAISELASDGTLLSGSNGYPGGGQGTAIDGSGNAWVSVPNNASSSVSEYSNSGVLLSGSSGFTGGGIYNPGHVAIDSHGNVWLNNGNSVSKLSNSGTPLSGNNGFTGGNLSGGGADGIAVDGAGYIWISTTNGTVFELSNDGTLVTLGGYYDPIVTGGAFGVAIDASGNIWMPSPNDDSLVEVVGIAAPVITPIAAGLPSTPTADGSSNLGTRP